MTQQYPPQYSPPPPPSPPGARPSRRPWWKGVWFIAAAALVVGLAIGAGAASGSNDKAEPGPTVTATATQTVTKLGPTTTLQPTVVKTIATRVRTHTMIYTPPPAPAFSDGTYAVGSDIKPGRYRSDPCDSGYSEIDKNLNGGIDSIVDNDDFDGTAMVQLHTGEFFKVDGGCQWRRVGS